MRFSNWFKRSEFECSCGCGYATIDAELLNVLEGVRENFRKPVNINSACRCVEHNETVQKEANKDYVPYSSKSKHMQGIAADIVVSGVEPLEVYRYLDTMYRDTYGIGSYNSFTHIDVRTVKARW